MTDRPQWLRCENCVWWTCHGDPGDPQIMEQGTCDGVPGHLPSITFPRDACALWSDSWPTPAFHTENPKPEPREETHP